MPAVLAITLAGGAAPPAPPTTADELVDIHLTADVTEVRPGRTFHLAVVFEIAPHWHIYWFNAGDSGLPTEVHVRAPDGFTVGPTLFPRPEVFREVGGRTYGYAAETVLFVPVTAPADLAAGEISLDVSLFYLVCRDRCFIGRTTRTLTLKVGAAGEPTPGSASSPALGTIGSDTAVLARHRRRLPRPLATLPGATARLERRGDETARLVVSGPAPDVAEAMLYPIEVPGVTFAEPEIKVEADRFRIAVDLKIRHRNALGEPMRAVGVIGLGSRIDQPCYAFDLPLEHGDHGDRDGR